VTAETATAWTAVPEPRVRIGGPKAVETESDDVIDQLRAEVERTLAAVRPEVVAIPLVDGQHAEPALRRAVRAVLVALPAEPEDALKQGLACAEAACEHLHYGELAEARMLLVAARGQLARTVTGRDRYHRVTSGSDAPAAVSGAAKIP
jgi:hypothetical protein